MKTRVISALVGLCILAVVIVFLDTLLFNVVICALSLLAVWELMYAAGLTRHRSLIVLTMLLALAIPFVRAGVVYAFAQEIIFVLILLFFLVLLRKHTELGIAEIGMAFFFGTVVPVFFSCAVHLRDDFGAVLGCFYILMALGSAWLSDSCAYFTGIRFGKHKLAPVISPKKTIEGSLGGLVFGSLLLLALAWLYSWIVGLLGFQVDVAYGKLLMVAPVVVVAGMLGDLSASAIKRGFHIKDYGHIMPGHGGVLDRFDSVLFTLPSMYILSRHVELLF